MPRREQLLEMLKQEPDDPFLNYALAMDDISQGSDAEGLGRLERLLKSDPDYVPTYLQCAQVLHRLGDTERSKDVLRQGIDVATRAGDHHAAAEMNGMLESF